MERISINLKPFAVAILFIVFFYMLGCAVVRQLANSGPEHLPPLRISNVPQVEEDEPPVVRTQDGYETSSIPSVPVKPPVELEYKTYIGISN